VLKALRWFRQTSRVPLSAVVALAGGSREQGQGLREMGVPKGRWMTEEQAFCDAAEGLLKERSLLKTSTKVTRIGQ